MTARTFTFLISQYGVIGITRRKAREGLQMMWGPHLVAVMRVFLVILAIAVSLTVFALSKPK